jgi:cell division protein FtsW
MGERRHKYLSTTGILIILTVMLTLIGLFFVFEASVSESYRIHSYAYYFLKQHSIWVLLGFFAMLLASFIPMGLWQQLSPIIYVASLILMSLVFIPGLGLELNGARRWLDLGFTTFQPIESAKFSLLIFFSSWLSKHQRWQPFLLMLGIPAVILLLQPDMGSMLILMAIAIGLYYLAGGRLKFLAIMGAAVVFLVSLAVVLSPYRLKRLTTYLNPDSDPLGASFHIKQITLALGSGGVTGQGLGNSRQRFSYIPEASSDSIFAIVGEEVGFVGSVVIICMFLAYFFLANRIAHKHKVKSFEYLVAMGIMIWIASQTILNLSAIVALVPLTGLPLPFFSYGGSSLVMVLFATGVLVRISKES